MRVEPLVSVLMPSYQQASFLSRSIASVQAQTHTEWELLVQDARSTDGTIELLKQASANDARIRWVSEPDSGPADALNRALKRARGTLIAWLNSDDLLRPDALASAVRHFTWNPRHLMVYGHGEHIDAQDHVLGRYPTVSVAQWMLSAGMTCQICQPTVMFKRSLAIALGDFDTSLKTAFDFDYWLRALKAFPHRIGFIDSVRAQSRLHGDTITARMRLTVALEGMSVVHRYVGLSDTHWVDSYLVECFGAKRTGDDPALRIAIKTELDRLGPSAVQYCGAQAFQCLTERWTPAGDTA